MKKLSPSDYVSYVEKNILVLNPFIGKITEFPELKLPFYEIMLIIFLDTNYQELIYTDYLNELIKTVQEKYEKTKI